MKSFALQGLTTTKTRAKKPDNIGAAADAFGDDFPSFVRELKFIKHIEPEVIKRYGFNVSSIFKHLLKPPTRKKGGQKKSIRSMDDDHSVLAAIIDEILIPAHVARGDADPLAEALKEAIELERLDGHPKSPETIRKYYRAGQRAIRSRRGK